MKKISIFLMLVITLITSASAAITVKCRIEGATLTDNMRIWAWIPGGANIFSAWPGQQLTNDGNGWYSYTFDESVSIINVIFNHGSGSSVVSQTGNIEGITSDACYSWTLQGGIIPSCANCETGAIEACDLPEITIKWKNSLGWASMQIYAWSGANHPCGDWPGETIAADGNGWYSKTINLLSIEGIILRGGSDQFQTVTIANLTHDTCVAPKDEFFNGTGLYMLCPADCQTGVSLCGGSSGGGDVTIRWKKSSEIDWTNMGIYEWSQGGGALCGAWPGIQVMPDEDGWYEYTFSETPEHIIFNNFIATQELGGKQVNGPISQTSDICVEIHTAYYCIADCETGEAPCSELEHFTVKWNNAQGWADMSIYAWIGEEGITELFGAYPGEIVTADGFGVYSKTFVKATPVNMIFISPTDFQQSSNIMGVYDDVCYNITSEIEYNELLEETFVCESIDCSTIATANTTLVKEDLQIMPNPATEKLYIQGNKKIQSITIYTVNGDKMTSLVGNHSSIDVSKLPKGSYLIQVKTETSTIVKKFVKN